MRCSHTSGYIEFKLAASDCEILLSTEYESNKNCLKMSSNHD